MRAHLMHEQTMLASVYSYEDAYSQGSVSAVTECEQGDRVWVKSYGSTYAEGSISFMYNSFSGFALEYY